MQSEIPESAASGSNRSLKKDKYATLPIHPKTSGKTGPDWALVAPLVYAPLLPLIRISLKNNPIWRDRLFFGAIGLATIHGFYVIMFRSGKGMS